LARILGMNSENLKETVIAWNRDITQGEDTQFGRTVHSEATEKPAYQGQELPVLSSPIKTPPYYALPLFPTLINTQGGPRRNSKAQVLDAFGDPIPRLFSAGELGSMWGLIYQGGGNITECMVFGRIAGKNAAAEKPWV